MKSVDRRIVQVKRMDRKEIQVAKSSRQVLTPWSHGVYRRSTITITEIYSSWSTHLQNDHALRQLKEYVIQLKKCHKRCCCLR